MKKIIGWVLLSQILPLGFALIGTFAFSKFTFWEWYTVGALVTVIYVGVVGLALLIKWLLTS